MIKAVIQLTAQGKTGMRKRSGGRMTDMNAITNNESYHLGSFSPSLSLSF